MESVSSESGALYNYTYVFPFEATFSPIPSTIWMQNYWQHSFTLSALYAILIYLGQRLMEKRSAFDLDSTLSVWNTGLAIFSIMGAVRMSPEFFDSLYRHGFQHSICVAEYAHFAVTGFWTCMFAFSKALELVDTVFIILRKRPLIFLHWYHHITVLVYTWHAYKDHTAAGRWFVWMNFNVHAWMYSYYALRSLGWRFPKWMAMSLTTLQIVQMLIGCFIGIQTYRAKRNDQYCQQTYENLYFSFAIYFTYFLLFARFFYNAYVRKGNRYQMRRGRVNANGIKNGHDAAELVEETKKVQ